MANPAGVLHAAPPQQAQENQVLPPAVVRQLADLLHNEMESASQTIRDELAQERAAACQKVKQQLEAAFNQGEAQPGKAARSCP